MKNRGRFGDIQQLEVKGRREMQNFITMLVDQGYQCAVLSHNVLDGEDIYCIEYTWGQDVEWREYWCEWVTEDERLALEEMRDFAEDDSEETGVQY